MQLAYKTGLRQLLKLVILIYQKNVIMGLDPNRPIIPCQMPKALALSVATLWEGS